MSLVSYKNAVHLLMAVKSSPIHFASLLWLLETVGDVSALPEGSCFGMRGSRGF